MMLFRVTPVCKMIGICMINIVAAVKSHEFYHPWSPLISDDCGAVPVALFNLQPSTSFGW